MFSEMTYFVSGGT